jgi:hypothetical protein
MNELYPAQFKLPATPEWPEVREDYVKRLKNSARLQIRHLPQLEPHEGKCAIVGGGPSVVNFVDQICEIKDGGLNTVMTVNAAHDWLIKQSIIPRIHVVFELDLDDVEQALGGKPHEDVVYYVSSLCHTTISRQLQGYKCVLWHPFMFWQEYQNRLVRFFPGEFMVASGYTTFFRSMTIAIILGYRDIELFGIDSSFEGSTHVDGYDMADQERPMKIWAKNPQTGELKEFTTQFNLAFQAWDFLRFCQENQSGLKLRVHGNGLLRHVHELCHPKQYERN